MFGRNSMNGCVQWLGIPNFLKTDGTAWNDNPLAPHPSWGDEGPSTNPNWGSQSPHHSDSISVRWNRPVCIIPVHHHMISENTRATACHVCDDILRANHLARMQINATCRNPIRNPQG